MTPVKRVAMLSLHTSPFDQPGGGDAGGMNVYVRSVALELAKVGIDVEIFTRAASDGQPHIEELGPGVLVRHLIAGPTRRVPKEVLPQLSDDLADAIADAIGAINRIAALANLPSFIIPPVKAGLSLHFPC